MPTNRCETRSISIPAPPTAVLAFVAEPANLPAWAPGFASSVRLDDGTVLVTQGATEFAIDVVVDETHRTVDLLAPGDHTLGAFGRVLPNGDGSEYLFTLFFPHDTPEEAVAAQMATVEEELTAVRALSGG